jgi:hypothetical protein
MLELPYERGPDAGYLPKDEPHGWKFLAIGPDGKLYFQVGAPCNICMPPDTHAQLRRINLDGSGMEVIARGIRQSPVHSFPSPHSPPCQGKGSPAVFRAKVNSL